MPYDRLKVILDYIEERELVIVKERRRRRSIR